MKNTITKIEKGSPLLRKANVGDRLVSINGNEINDVLDYMFFSYDSKLTVVLESENGKTRSVRVKKPAGDSLGLEFETYLMDRARACGNRCVFCFVDQLPRDMRRTLYFKDDDARLSFLTGNYITLTNLTDKEVKRIIDLKISPINISVHATEASLRAKLLGNPAGARGYELMQQLASGGVTMNCQVVVCPGLNDGEALCRTMSDLAALYPQVNSVSIVPVGLTKYREGLSPLLPFDKKTASDTVDMVEAFACECLEKHGSRIFYPSDEFFLKAGRELPVDEYYEGYPQLENGVGMLRLLREEFADALENDLLFCDGEQFSIATGVSAAPFLTKLLVTAQEKYVNMDGKVFPIANDFFGHAIDVAGLITGGDLISQLRGKALGKRLLIPGSMLRDGEGVFLDDVTLEDVRRELGVEVIPVETDGAALLRAMAEGSFSKGAVSEAD